MSVTLRQPLTLAECQQVRVWRNDPAVLPMLRTGHKTVKEQVRFYHDVICTNEAQPEHLYYAIEADGHFAGMGGLTYIEWSPEKGSAEISLIVNPAMRGQGVGEAAVDALCLEAKRLDLVTLIGECYREGAVGFWAKAITKRPARLWWEWEL